MTSSVQTLPAGGSSRRFSARPYWAAIAVLGVAVVALGASLIHVVTRPADGHAVFATADPLQEFAAAQDADHPAPLAVTTVAPGESVVPPSPKPRAATAASAEPPSTRRAAPRAAVAPGPAPTPPPTDQQTESVPAAMALATPAPYVVTESGVVRTPAPANAPTQRVVCAGCGRVEAVTPVGNNTANTIVYLVQVRMDDGSLRRFERTTAPVVGMAVVVDGVQSPHHAVGAPTLRSRSEHTPAAAAPGAKVYATERN